MTFKTTTDPRPADLRQRARQWRDDGQRAAHDAARNARRYTEQGFDKAPLVFGALAFGIGAGIAALLPRTRQERAYLGRYSDRLYDEVSAIYHEERAKLAAAADHAATQAKAAMRDE